MLRTIRTTSAIVIFTLITLLFLDFTGTLHSWFGWLAKVQLVPAILALNIGVIIFLLLLTLLFGRIYCSVICPLGIFQDVISWFSKKTKKNRYSYSPAVSWLRYATLAVFVITLILGFSTIYTVLEPYSAYGRMASSLLSPLYQWGNNVIASLAERAESYTFYSTEVWMKSILTLGISVATILVVSFLAWRYGRTYCNTICPVGTVLGFVSRFSLFRPVFNTEKCNSCGLCAMRCKASCIDSKNHKIDYSRCVTCLNCIEECKHGAIRYASVLKKPKAELSTVQPINTHNTSRRSFLTIGAGLAVASALKAQEKNIDGGLAEIEDKKIPNRDTAIVPPGAMSVSNMAKRCTACQLCISACPNQVLRPSGDFLKFMQPEMSFERGYCRPECIKCSEVCPTGAIKTIDKADKSAIQIGHAVWIKDNCIVLRDGVQCNNCQRHCPTDAIQMVSADKEKTDGLQIPIVDVERCIGCGACENLCPARPFSAIYVEGHLMHRTI